MNVFIDEEGKHIKCLLLASFELEREIFQTKRILWFKKRVLSEKFVKSALIFIPWQHRMKELRIVETDKIISKDTPIDGGFIKVKDFVSPYEEERPYYCEFRIRNFYGYDFIYDYSNFIANVFQQDSAKCCELLYEKKPELLSLDNGL